MAHQNSALLFAFSQCLIHFEWSMCTILNQLFISNTRAQQDSPRTSRTSRIHIYLFSFFSTHLHNIPCQIILLLFHIIFHHVLDARVVCWICLDHLSVGSSLRFHILLWSRSPSLAPDHKLPLQQNRSLLLTQSFSLPVTEVLPTLRSVLPNLESSASRTQWLPRYCIQSTTIPTHSSLAKSLPSGSLPLLASVLHAKVSRSEHAVCVGYTRVVFFSVSCQRRLSCLDPSWGNLSSHVFTLAFVYIGNLVTFLDLRRSSSTTMWSLRG